MPFEFNCPSCYATLRVPDEARGKTVNALSASRFPTVPWNLLSQSNRMVSLSIFLRLPKNNPTKHMLTSLIPTSNLTISKLPRPLRPVRHTGARHTETRGRFSGTWIRATKARVPVPAVPITLRTALLRKIPIRAPIPARMPAPNTRQVNLEALERRESKN